MLMITRYSSAAVGVKLPGILLVPGEPNTRLRGCEAGAVQFGKGDVVVALFVKGAVATYNGSTTQKLFHENV